MGGGGEGGDRKKKAEAKGKEKVNVNVSVNVNVHVTNHCGGVSFCALPAQPCAGRCEQAQFFVSGSLQGVTLRSLDASRDFCAVTGVPPNGLLPTCPGPASKKTNFHSKKTRPCTTLEKTLLRPARAPARAGSAHQGRAVQGRAVDGEGDNISCCCCSLLWCFPLCLAFLWRVSRFFWPSFWSVFCFSWPHSGGFFRCSAWDHVKELQVKKYSATWEWVPRKEREATDAVDRPFEHVQHPTKASEAKTLSHPPPSKGTMLDPDGLHRSSYSRRDNCIPMSTTHPKA